MARPLTITAAKTEAICAQLKLGKPLYASAAQCGVSRSTIKTWMRTGNEAIAKREEGYDLTGSEPLYATFAEQAQLARDVGESWLIDKLYEAAADNKQKWQAYMTMLERTRPDDWRRRASAEYIDRDKTPAARLDVSHLDATERAQLRMLLAKVSGDK